MTAGQVAEVAWRSLTTPVFGSPNSTRGRYGNVFLGLYPRLVPLYIAVALAGFALTVSGVVMGDWGLAVIGVG